MESRLCDFTQFFSEKVVVELVDEQARGLYVGTVNHFNSLRSEAVSTNEANNKPNKTRALAETNHLQYTIQT